MKVYDGPGVSSPPVPMGSLNNEEVHEEAHAYSPETCRFPDQKQVVDKS